MGIVINWSQVQLPAVLCRVSIRMGDHVWAGKPSQDHDVTSHLGQLSLPSLRGR